MPLKSIIKEEPKGSNIDVIFAEKAVVISTSRLYGGSGIFIKKAETNGGGTGRANDLISYHEKTRPRLRQIFGTSGTLVPQTKKIIVSDTVIHEQRETGSGAGGESEVVYETKVRGIIADGNVILVQNMKNDEVLKTLTHEMSHPFITRNMFEVLVDHMLYDEKRFLNTANVFFRFGYEEGIAEFLNKKLTNNNNDGLVTQESCLQLGKELVTQGVTWLSNRDEFVNLFSDAAKSIYQSSQEGFMETVSQMIKPIKRSDKENSTLIYEFVAGNIFVGSALFAYGSLNEQVDTKRFIDGFVLSPTSVVPDLLRKTDTASFGNDFKAQFLT